MSSTITKNVKTATSSHTTSASTVLLGKTDKPRFATSALLASDLRVVSAVNAPNQPIAQSVAKTNVSSVRRVPEWWTVSVFSVPPPSLIALNAHRILPVICATTTLRRSMTQASAPSAERRTTGSRMTPSTSVSASTSLMLKMIISVRLVTNSYQDARAVHRRTIQVTPSPLRLDTIIPCPRMLASTSCAQNVVTT